MSEFREQANHATQLQDNRSHTVTFIGGVLAGHGVSTLASGQTVWGISEILAGAIIAAARVDFVRRKLPSFIPK